MSARELALELALDRLSAALSAELPAHVRACARAHAAGAPEPPAPAALARPQVLSLSLEALTYPALAPRGLALLALAAPVIIESDPGVARARAADRTWPALVALAAAREAASRTHLGVGFLALMHALHGASDGDLGAASATLAEHAAPGWASATLPDLEPPAGWTQPERALDSADIEAVWRELAQRHGAAGRLEIVASDAPPRAFVVEPGCEVIAIVPSRVASPAARFAVLHELGHALAALLSREQLPRAVDEAAASWAARAMEAPPHPWFSRLALEARIRRTALAARLYSIERGAAPPPGTRPPRALWRDPGAQAAYVHAEPLAEAWQGAPLAQALAAATRAVSQRAVSRLLTLIREARR